MSAPVNEFQQPTFSQKKESVLESKPVELTNEQLNASNKFPYLWVWVLLTIFLLFVGPFIGVQSLISQNDAARAARISSGAQTCPNGQVEVERDAPGDNLACITTAKHDKLLNTAAAYYDAKVTHGEPIYKKWLAAHKLAPNTEAAREMTAKRYICKSNGSGDGSLYAASIAGIDEGVSLYMIDGYVIRLAEYNPEDVSCYKGAPLPPKKVYPPISGMEPPSRVEPPTNRP